VPIVPAGAPIVQDGEYELFSSGFPVHLTVNLYGTQPVTVFVFPDAPVTPPYASVNLSTGLTLDAVPVNYPDDLRLQFQLASDGAIQ
jgi:hypothetical protein